VREGAARPRTKRWVVLRAALATLFVLSLLLSAHAGAAECVGDECQIPPPAPEELTPGTAVLEAPPNPPVHYPKVRKHHHRNHRGKQ
jgi:hypothetical protein